MINHDGTLLNAIIVDYISIFSGYEKVPASQQVVDSVYQMTRSKALLAISIRLAKLYLPL